jgi:hypothetical protein
MRDTPLPRQAPASSGVRSAVGVGGAREIAAQGDPSMMDDEKKQRLIQAIMRARGMIA